MGFATGHAKAGNSAERPSYRTKTTIYFSLPPGNCIVEITNVRLIILVFGRQQHTDKFRAIAGNA
jgi:hypothetical protein